MWGPSRCLCCGRGWSSALNRPASLLGHTDYARGFPPGPPLLGLRASLDQCFESGTTVRMLTKSFRIFFYCGKNQVTIFIVPERPAGLLCTELSAPLVSFR